MPGEYHRCTGKRVDLLANRALQHREIAAGKIGPPDPAIEKRIADERDAGRAFGRSIRRHKEQYVARAMPGDVANLELPAQRSDSVSVLQPTVDGNAFDGCHANGKPFHHCRIFNQLPIRLVSPHPGTGPPLHGRSLLRVIPVAVSQPEFRQTAALLRKDRLDLGKDFPRGIDQHRLSKSGLCEKITNRLNRARRQNVNLHRP